MIEKLEDWIVGHVTFPTTNALFNRRGVMRAYARSRKTEYYPPEKMEQLQVQKLRQLLQHANRYCPHYATKFKQIGLIPEDVRTLSDFAQIPALSRQDVIGNCDSIVDIRQQSALEEAKQSKRAPGQPVTLGQLRGKALVRNSSSGSTGAPVIFYDDGSIAAASWAFEMRIKGWYGVHPGAREARMARISVDYLPKDFQLWTRKRLWHQLMLPGVNLADKEYALCVQKLRSFRPQILWGFTSALAGLADYVRRSGENVSDCSPELAIGWAAPVYEHEERLLREVFHCSVTNIYGAREVGHVAAWCPNHSWHINQEHMLVESNGNPRDGEIGEIIVTPLDISAMPFIRYRLGDLGRPAFSHCDCGRTLQVLEEFLGRTGEVFVTKDGRMIPPNFWCRFFMVDGQSQFVERFQIIYRAVDCVSIRIVKRQGFSDHTEEDMKRILRKNFSSEVHFEFEYVPRIDPQISGKYQMVVNESRNEAPGERYGCSIGSKKESA